MGVVNLSIIIDRLKKAMSGDFVKSTDYASKSKFGIVKIGDGISVSNGKISANAGLTKTDLWIPGDVPTEAGSTSTVLTLLDDIDKYKFITIGITGADGKNLVNIVLDTDEVVIGSGDDSQIAFAVFNASGSDVTFAGKFTAKKEFTVTAQASGIYFKKIVGIN